MRNNIERQERDEVVLQAEKGLTRRQFSKALNLSKQVLQAYSREDHDSRALQECRPTKDCLMAGTDTTEKEKLVDLCSFDPNQKNGSFWETPMVVPLDLLERRKPEESIVVCDVMRASWKVCLSDEITPWDRASVVCIQSAYEMLRRSTRNEANAKTKSTGTSWDVFTHIDPFLRLYRKGSDDTTSRKMPLELAIVWIKFCRSLRCYGTSAITASELLRSIVDQLLLVGSSAPVWLLGLCEDLIYYLFIEVLPFISDHQFVEGILKEADITRDIEMIKAPTFLISPEPDEESVEIILVNINNPDFFLRSLFPDILALCHSELYRLQGNISSSSFTPQCLHVMHENQEDEDIVVQKMPLSYKYDTTQSTPHRQELPFYDHHGFFSEIYFFQILQNHIINPLWFSEERWANRARTATAGVTAIFLMRRRKRILSVAHTSAYVAMAPFKEIVEAFTK